MGARDVKHRDFTVEPLNKRHDKDAFSCGVAALDRYLQRQASQDVAKHAAVCFVLTNDGTTVAGFYTLSQYSVDLNSLPESVAKKLPRYPILPATFLGRLAVSSGFRGHKLGEFLLLDALHRSLQQSSFVASTAIIVDAKDDTAKSFYEHFGFLRLPQIANRLFLPMATIQKLFN